MHDGYRPYHSYATEPHLIYWIAVNKERFKGKMRNHSLPVQNFIGLMQGRLLPKYHGRFQAHPIGYWQEEFPKAAALGLDFIEFILDLEGADQNPLIRPDGP
jgi:hypothetical protein